MTVNLPRISVQLSHDVRVVQQFFEALAELNIRVQPETKNRKTWTSVSPEAELHSNILRKWNQFGFLQ